jgi:hypothetical protein
MQFEAQLEQMVVRVDEKSRNLVFIMPFHDIVQISVQSILAQLRNVSSSRCPNFLRQAKEVFKNFDVYKNLFTLHVPVQVGRWLLQ